MERRKNVYTKWLLAYIAMFTFLEVMGRVVLSKISTVRGQYIALYIVFGVILAIVAQIETKQEEIWQERQERIDSIFRK